MHLFFTLALSFSQAEAREWLKFTDYSIGYGVDNTDDITAKIYCISPSKLMLNLHIKESNISNISSNNWDSYAVRAIFSKNNSLIEDGSVTLVGDADEQKSEGGQTIGLEFNSYISPENTLFFKLNSGSSAKLVSVSGNFVELGTDKFELIFKNMIAKCKSVKPHLAINGGLTPSMRAITERGQILSEQEVEYLLRSSLRQIKNGSQLIDYLAKYSAYQSVCMPGSSTLGAMYSLYDYHIANLGLDISSAPFKQISYKGDTIIGKIKPNVFCETMDAIARDRDRFTFSVPSIFKEFIRVNELNPRFLQSNTENFVGAARKTVSAPISPNNVLSSISRTGPYDFGIWQSDRNGAKGPGQCNMNGSFEKISRETKELCLHGANGECIKMPENDYIKIDRDLYKTLYGDFRYTFKVSPDKKSFQLVSGEIYNAQRAIASWGSYQRAIEKGIESLLGMIVYKCS